jgi:hypothetical protein
MPISRSVDRGPTEFQSLDRSHPLGARFSSEDVSLRHRPPRDRRTAVKAIL